MESFEEYLERRKNELLQEKPQDVNFTFSKEQVQQIIDEYNQQHNKSSDMPIYDDWERGTWGSEAYHTAQDVINAVEAYNNLSDKNDFKQVGTIASSLEHIYDENMNLPPEIVTTINEIIKHSNHLEYLTYLNEQQIQQENERQQESIREQTELKEQQQTQEQQIQQARYNEIQSRLPAINEQLNRIRELPKNSDLYETRKNELLRERLYFYHKINRSAEDFLTGKANEITQEDMDRLNDYLATLDSIEQEIVNSNKQVEQQEQTQEPEIKTEQSTMQNDQEQINQLKEQIQQYDNQIAFLLAGIQPYRQVPKINNEISKVIAKNDEINSSQIIDSLADYQRVVEMKQQLVTYLQQADKVIKDKVAGLQQQEQKVEEPVQEQQSNNQTLDDDTWAWMNTQQQSNVEEHEQQNQQSLSDEDWQELFPPQENQVNTNQSFEEIMADFENPSPNARPERIYNDDGTYTMEYITHVANTPLGFNQTIFDQLMQSNYEKRHQNNNQMTTSQQADAMIQAMVNGQLDTNGQPIVDNQEQMTNDRQMGFAKVWLLGLITTLVSVGIIVLGIMLTK